MLGILSQTRTTKGLKSVLGLSHSSHALLTTMAQKSHLLNLSSLTSSAPLSANLYTRYGNENVAEGVHHCSLLLNPKDMLTTTDSRMTCQLPHLKLVARIIEVLGIACNYEFRCNPRCNSGRS